MNAIPLLTTIENNRIARLQETPGKEETAAFAQAIIALLFPTRSAAITQRMNEYWVAQDQLRELLCPVTAAFRAETETFFAALPDIYERLLADAQATLDRDPAASSLTEVVVAYPGFWATAVYRIAHQLQQQKIPLLPRLLSQYAHAQTGIDIHPAAQIGQGLAIDHGTGVVIGETAVVGHNVTLYQGVTLGALRVEKRLAGSKRHPTVKDHVTIYANATVLGGDTVIGHHAVVAGNGWITASLPPYANSAQPADVNPQRQQPVRPRSRRAIWH